MVFIYARLRCRLLTTLPAPDVHTRQQTFDTAFGVEKGASSHPNLPRNARDAISEGLSHSHQQGPKSRLCCVNCFKQTGTPRKQRHQEQLLTAALFQSLHARAGDAAVCLALPDVCLLRHITTCPYPPLLKWNSTDRYKQLYR